MSLISDALKEAQRERGERVSPTERATPSAAKTLFSPSERKKSQWSIPIYLVIIAVAVVVLSPVTIVLVRARMARDAATPTVAATDVARASSPSTGTVLPASQAASAPTHPVVPQAKPVRATDSARPPAPVSRSAAVASSPHVQLKRIETRTANADARLQTAAIEPTATEPLSPSSLVTSASPSGVRVVLEPSNTRPGDSLFAQAFVEQSRGNYDRAAELYEHALQSKPVSPQLYNDYGALLASRGNEIAAIAMYNLGLKSDAHEPRLWINLGDSYKALGRHADAMSAYAEASKYDPTNASLKTRLASEYAAIGDSANARRGFEDATHIAPRDAAVHHAFGVFLQGQHDYRGAMREFQSFVDLAPGKFPAETVEAMKAHIARLAKAAP